MSKKKVVFLISSSIGGGAQILLLDLAKYLREELNLKIVCPHGYLSEHLKKNNFFPLITKINSHTIKMIHRDIMEWADGEDIVLNPFLFGTSFYVCNSFRNERNCHIFSLLLNPIIRNELPFYKKIAYKYIAKTIGIYSNAIGVGSPELEEEVKRLTGRQPIYLENRVPNKHPLKKIFYDGKRALKVCFVGRMENQKRPDLFVETARLIKIRNVNIKFYMAGEGTLLNKVKEYIKVHSLDNIVNLVGFQEDIYDFLEQMDILLLTSEFENTPLIMLNAMNASVPIICGNVKGVTHLIDNNINGIIVDQYTAKAFSEALIILAGEPGRVKDLSLEAYNKAIGDLSYEKFAKRYLLALEDCYGG